ncbi:hypothetical protein [Photobacterium leiognathi]|uniref:hypothetical protein n=1 Tax=Photobacterium leiognathi TaxID=553611 RepID=UPI000D163757|nr:hypothetical protein [Photobacterium leiognathi]PSW53036.1 hypothetical protein C0W50_19705 [Photobacterium leiognathi subsp. mandapamensis]
MKLSHKKKLASKKGTWWPFTRQARLRIELKKHIAVQQLRYAVNTHGIALAAIQAAKALVGFKDTMMAAAKTWLLGDKSQQQQPSPKTGFFCRHIPQKEIKIKINHKTT